MMIDAANAVLPSATQKGDEDVSRMSSANAPVSIDEKGRPATPESPARLPGKWPKPVIGLIGGIGAGKSLVASLLARKGARILDADRVGHEILTFPDVREALVQRFGPSILTDTRTDNRTIDRAALAKVVFADPSAKAALEEIVHPRMGIVLRDRLEQAMADPAVPIVVLDAAILVESGWDHVCDEILFVDADRSVRLQRVEATRGWSDADLTSREAAQWPLETKKRRADSVITNDGSPEQCQEKVDRWWNARLANTSLGSPSARDA